MIKLFLYVLLCCFSLSAHAWQPFTWTSSNIQGLYGGDFILSEPQRGTVTIEHAHGWKYGDNFFFVDMYNSQGFEVYAEVYSNFSLSKITGKKVAWGVVKDVSLMLGLNISNRPESRRFQAYLWGVNLDLANAYFDYLSLSIAAYKDDAVASYGVQITPVWSYSFHLAQLGFKFKGFVDIKDGKSNAEGNVTMLAQPQILLDVGALSGWKSGVVYMGMEYSYWLNKYGIKGKDESALQGMVSVFF